MTEPLLSTHNQFQFLIGLHSLKRDYITRCHDTLHVSFTTKTNPEELIAPLWFMHHTFDNPALEPDDGSDSVDYFGPFCYRKYF